MHPHTLAGGASLFISEVTILITKELVERINELARKQKDGGLTEEEKTEQKSLRKIYLKNIRAQVIGTLESAGLKPRRESKTTCDCGCSAQGEADGCSCEGGQDHDHPDQDKLVH